MHNDYLISVLLGIIEGLTEFLPVSSTAHLRIAEKLFDLQLQSGYWKMYTIVIQLGAIAALPIYFSQRILKFVKTYPQGEIGDRNWLTHPLALVMIAFVVTALPSYLLAKKIGDHLDNFYIIGSALLIGGVVMWGVDSLVNRPWVNRMEEMSLLQAIWIGACQILSAVFPGTSRSMATIAAGQMIGMSRAAALEFSFFLSMPTMFVATAYALFKTIHPKADADHPIIDGHGWLLLLIGMVVSFVVSLGVIAWFMGWVRKRGFAPFALYRIVVGVAVLFWARRMALQQ